MFRKKVTMSKSTEHNIASFRAAYAARAAQWATVGAVSQAGLLSDLAYVGITASVKASETPAVELEITTDDTEGLPAGTTRDQFTSEALAEFDAATLHRVRHNVWSLIRARQQHGHISSDEAMATLESLGFGPASMPKLESDVSLYMYNSDGEQIRVGFRTTGKPSKDDVVAKFTPLSGEDPRNAVIRQAYPDATKLPEKVTEVRISTSVNWPDDCD